MKVKVAFAAGLFCVVFSMFGSSQDIPDGVVYTEVKKTLVNGTTGILRCRFKGDPNAVFWKKGSDPAKSPSIIILSYGEKSGPRYEDDSCDIDANYSLVIRNVKNTDAGRYICRVSNYKGILIYNYTDVMITNSAVRTEQSVAVQKDKVGIVPCQVNIRPKTVSWVRDTNDTLVTVSMDLSRPVVQRSGPGYEEGLFNITSEYSLLINDVKILHEDSYFCEVTDFDTGHLFRNVSKLNVFAFPLEPFPSIEECPREQQELSSCTLRIASGTMLTCEVREYYPVIDLFFKHGSLRVDSLETRVWNNSDGTRNKRITIPTNGTSETVFECVAKGLVGEAESRSMTIHLIRNVQQTRVAVAVVSPVILVSTIIVIAVYVMKRRKRHLKRKYAKFPMLYKAKQRDLMSYIELWRLVQFAREEKVSVKLENVLDKLIIDEENLKPLQTDEDYYNDFCQWKAGYTGTCQRKDFFDACRKAELKSALDELQKYSDSTQAVTADDLEHTMWHIVDSDSVIGLLEDLGAPHEHLEVLKGKGKREVVEGAMNILKQWRDANSFGNQEVMLSLALETIPKYTPSNKDFFRVPDCQKRGLDMNEIQAFLLPEITSRHCTELIKTTMDFGKKYYPDIKFVYSKNKDVWMDNIIKENRTALFDSHQMIKDWWAELNCSNYEKRCRLQRASKDITDVRRYDRVESDEEWPATKKLEQIAKLVPQQSMIQLCSALHIPCTLEDLADEEKRLEAMCRWRYIMAGQKQEKKHKALSAALKAIDFDGLLSRPKGIFIYKAELVDLALGLIMEDFRPFAKTLGIRETKFTSYRQDFCASHLGVGTISLVFQLFEMYQRVFITNRPSFSSIVDKAGYSNVMKRFNLACEPSYGELLAIATAVITNGETKVDEEFTETNEEKKAYDSSVVVEMKQISSNDADGEANANNFKVVKEPIDEIRHAIKSNFSVHDKKGVGDLQRMLELTDEDIPDSDMASVLTLLKIWKESVCPGLIDHRVVLAEGLQKINKPHVVAAVMNGRYQVGQTGMDFITDMLARMDASRETSLKSLLEREDQTIRLKSSDITSQWIFDWVADWTKKMGSSIMNTIRDIGSKQSTPERHVYFNDKLVDNGYLELAREIINIEQVL